MQETRRLRLQSVIQEELSLVVSREIKDPRVPAVTFTGVEVNHDGSQAIILVSILGSIQNPEGLTPAEEKEAKLRIKNCIEGLTSASGFLRRHLAKVLNVRHVPSLVFKEDRGFENTVRVHELLKKISQTS